MKSHLKLGALAILMASVGLTSAASALPRGHDSAPSFEELDANGDGAISDAEIAAFHDARFAEFDTDGDGSLSEAELTAMAEAHAAERAAKGVARMIKRHDENGDGVLSADELPQPDGSRMFARVDADDDGVISAEEFEAAAEKRAERGGKRGGHGGKGHGHGKGDRD